MRKGHEYNLIAHNRRESFFKMPLQDSLRLIKGGSQKVAHKNEANDSLVHIFKNNSIDFELQKTA